ncbi:MAG: hypothetical protein HYY44_08730 [Deltaproteobacteria bacterium]|nr:hypothetical protein [Deltaproteobacteria bacterium]MBI4373314.1 hypothetical protein [Deltaproteobacteria bacterium]
MHKKSPLTDEEIRFFKALQKKKVPFLVVGLSAANLQGAPVVTQDIDLWFKSLPDPKLIEALNEVRGFYVPPFGLNPPLLGGDGLELLDIVLTLDGLKSFDYEYKRSRTISLEGIRLKVLPLERIIKSKKAAGRLKDKAALPVLEDALKTIRARR